MGSCSQVPSIRVLSGFPEYFLLEQSLRHHPSTDTPGYLYSSFKIYPGYMALNKAPSHLFTSPTVPELRVLGGQDWCFYLYVSSADHRAWNIVGIHKGMSCKNRVYLNLSKALLNWMKSNLALLKSKLFYLQQGCMALHNAFTSLNFNFHTYKIKKILIVLLLRCA